MNTLKFYLNGRPVQLDNIDPAMPLIDYLRSGPVGLTGTKKSGGDGGSGSSAVMLSLYNAGDDTVTHKAIDSCLFPMGSLEGTAVTTIEGIGSVKSEISRVQYRIAAGNGSQCGFCTPGFVMTMYSFLAENGGRKILKKEIEELFSGNICRCTGYRPILQAMKSFAADWTAKDQTGSMSCQTDDPGITVYEKIRTQFPAPLRKKTAALHLQYKGINWFRPSCTEELYALLESHGQVETVQLVNGNTYPLKGADTFIDISRLQELNLLKIENNTLVIGAGVTYNQFLRWVQPLIRKTKATSELHKTLESLKYMASRVSGHLIRNVASFGGDTMRMVRDTACVSGPSDMLTSLLALGALLRVKMKGPKQGNNVAIITLADFMDKKINLHRPVILCYTVPLPVENTIIRTFKTARRKDNGFAVVNGAILVRFDSEQRVEEAALVFGVGGVGTFHATETEAYLKGKKWQPGILPGALSRLDEEVAAKFNAVENSPANPASKTYDGISMAYKQGLVQSFFYKYFIYSTEKIAPGTIAPQYRTAAQRLARKVSSGSQTYKRYPGEYPVNEPLVNRSAFKQATGEAIYTHDIPLPARGLYVAVVTTTRACGSFGYKEPVTGETIQIARLLTILQEKFNGFVDYICAGNMPEGCTNLQSDEARKGDGENLFCLPGTVESFGQAVGITAAESEKTALAAAAFIRDNCIAYDSKGKTPVLT
ncbi:MAG: hypothetical protein GY757_44480, partial [bacterium]|nr:hypothetical protein [bacterium]